MSTRTSCWNAFHVTVVGHFDCCATHEATEQCTRMLELLLYTALMQQCAIGHSTSETLNNSER
jgi:hypothetical protein